MVLGPIPGRDDRPFTRRGPLGFVAARRARRRQPVGDRHLRRSARRLRLAPGPRRRGRRPRGAARSRPPGHDRRSGRGARRGRPDRHDRRGTRGPTSSPSPATRSIPRPAWRSSSRAGRSSTAIARRRRSGRASRQSMSPMSICPIACRAHYVLRTSRLLGPAGSIRDGRAGGRRRHDRRRPATRSSRATTCRRFDLGDAVVTPGLTPGFSTLGQARAMAESAGADAGFLAAADAFDPTDRVVRDLVAGGVLRAVFAPGSANVVAGAVATIRLGADEPVVDPVAGIDFVLLAAAREPDRYPASLPGQIDLIREFLGLAGDASASQRPFDYELSYPVLERCSTRSESDRVGRLRAGDAARPLRGVQDRPRSTRAWRSSPRRCRSAALVGPGAIEGRLDEIERLATDRGAHARAPADAAGPRATRRHGGGRLGRRGRRRRPPSPPTTRSNCGCWRPRPSPPACRGPMRRCEPSFGPACRMPPTPADPPGRRGRAGRSGRLGRLADRPGEQAPGGRRRRPVRALTERAPHPAGRRSASLRIDPDEAHHEGSLPHVSIGIDRPRRLRW